MTLILNTKRTSAAAFATSSRVRRSDRLKSLDPKRGGGGADPVDIDCSDKELQLGGGQAMSQI